MGKTLIIRGADFSENKVSKFENVSKSMVIVRGISGITLSDDDNNRAGLNPRINLTSFINEGYTKAVLTCKNDGVIAGITTSSSANPSSVPSIFVVGTSGTWGKKGSYIFDLDKERPYVFVHLNLDETGIYKETESYLSLLLYK